MNKKTALFNRKKKPDYGYLDIGHYDEFPTVLWAVDESFKFHTRKIEEDDDIEFTHSYWSASEIGKPFIMWGRVDLDPKGQKASMAATPDLVDNPFLLNKLEKKVTKWLDHEFDTPKIFKFFNVNGKMVKTAQFFEEPSGDRSHYTSIGHEMPELLENKEKVILWVLDEDGRFHEYDYDNDDGRIYGPTHSEYRGEGTFPDDYLAQGRVKINSNKNNEASICFVPHINPVRRRYLSKKIDSYLSKRYDYPTIYDYTHENENGTCQILSKSQKNIKKSFSWYKKMKKMSGGRSKRKKNTGKKSLGKIAVYYDDIGHEYKHDMKKGEKICMWWMNPDRSIDMKCFDKNSQDVKSWSTHFEFVNNHDELLAKGRVHIRPGNRAEASMIINTDIINPIQEDAIKKRSIKFLDTNFNMPMLHDFTVRQTWGSTKKMEKMSQVDSELDYLEIGHQPYEYNFHGLNRREKPTGAEKIWTIDEDWKIHIDDATKSHETSFSYIARGRFDEHGREGQSRVSILFNDNGSILREKYTYKKVVRILNRVFDYPEIHTFSSAEKMEKKAFPIVEKDAPSSYGSIGHYNGAFPENNKEILWVIYKDNKIEQTVVNRNGKVIHEQMWKGRIDDVLASGRLVKNQMTGELIASARLHDIYFKNNQIDKNKEEIDKNKEEKLRNRVSKILDNTFDNPKIYIYN